MALNNLPGFESDYRDGGLTIANRGVSTGSVLVLGTAVDGPPLMPIPIVRLEDAEKIFGPAGSKGVSNGSTLIKGLYEAYNAGSRDIRLMRITGTTASATLSCVENNVTVVKSISQTLGISSGNTQFLINIKGAQGYPEGSEVIPGSVSVTVDNVLLDPALYSVNFEAGTVTVPADIVRGGASVKATYSRLDHADTAVANDPFWNSDGVYKIYRSVAGYNDLASSPAAVVKVARVGAATTMTGTGGTADKEFTVAVVGAIATNPAAVVKVNGTTKTLTTDYTINATTGVITFVEAQAADAVVTVDCTYEPVVTTNYTIDLTEGKVTFGTALLAGDVVTVSFTYDKKTVVSTSGNPAVPLSVTTTPNGADQSFDLYARPIALDATKPFKLYVDGQQQIAANFYVDYENKKAVLRANKVAVGKTVVASYHYNEVTDNTPKIVAETVPAGSIYNSLEFRLSRIHQNDDENNIEIGKKIVIAKPDSKKSSAYEPDMSFSSLDYPTLGDVVKAINAHALNDIIRCEVVDEYASVLTANLHIPDIDGDAQENVTIKFTGGTDGLNKTAAEIYTILGGQRDAAGNIVVSGVYDLLMNYQVDTVSLSGLWADEVLPFSNFAEQLANFCARSTMRNNETIGTISVKPLHSSKINLAGIQEYTDKLVARGNNYYYLDDSGNYVYDSQGNPLDVGRYINVTVGEISVAQNALGKYSASMANSYAGLISVLAPGNATTNKLMPNASALKYDFSAPQLDALVGARYVVAQNKYGRGVVVVDGVTAAQKGSDYSRLSTLRIATAAVHLIRQVTDPFIGGKNNIVMRNAMSTEIDHALAAMKKSGDLQDYSFSIISSTRDAVMGNALIELKIVPAFELRNIKLVISLRPSL